ncbi:MAG: hypothetical protein WA395_15915 [Nitrososphaeraceae archaeon]
MTSISNPLNVKKLSGQKDCSRIFFAAVGSVSLVPDSIEDGYILGVPIN